MPIDTYLHMGSFHTDHCEDSLLATSLTADIQLLAVMDGCSSGTDSFFVATLAARLLRKLAAERYHRDFRESTPLSLSARLETLMADFWPALRSQQHQLQLSRHEMMFTLGIALLDTRARAAEVLVVGDGIVCCNGAVTAFDHDNRPDYLGYHLSEPFAGWWAQQSQRLQYTEVRDLCLSTDGIDSFRPAVVGQFPAIGDAEILRHVLMDAGTFKAKVAGLLRTYGLAPADDLGLLRWVE